LHRSLVATRIRDALTYERTHTDRTVTTTYQARDPELREAALLAIGAAGCIDASKIVPLG
jgi:hypothetical protein